MTLIILLLCLGIEHFTGLGARLRHYCWYDAYVRRWYQYLQNYNIGHGLWGALIIIMPLVIAMGLMQYFLADVFYGLLGMLIAALVLLYCLGANIEDSLHAYLDAAKREDAEGILDAAKKCLGADCPTQLAEIPKAMNGFIFREANTRLFSVLFWFVLLGPLGAILYRATERLSKACDSYPHLGKGACRLVDFLHWPAIRVVGLFYVLAGHFTAAFGCWYSHWRSPVKHNDEVLLGIATCALGREKEEESVDHTVNREACALVKRVLVVALVMIAMCTIAILLA